MATARDDVDRARLEAELAAARERYDALRRRKAVRAALAVARLRPLLSRVATPTARKGPPPPPEPAATASPPAAPAPPATRSPPPAPPAPAPQPAGEEVAHCWPLGHFYSPVPDTRDLRREPTRSRVWPREAGETPGIDWRDDEQVALVRDVLAHQDELAFPAAPTGDPIDFHTANEMFTGLDAWALQAMLRWLRPARMIEVGSGWSSLIAARVNRELLGGTIDLTCIEPYPPEFLERDVPGISRLLRAPVQEVPLSTFAELGEGDVLFIDSSHVAKTGSDCNHLYQEVLPRLRPGVVIHVHDIFLPWDYPQEWVLSGRGWNEQYLLRAFLSFNDAFEILLGNVRMAHRHPDVLAAAVAGYPASTPDGGSLWMRRVR